MSFSLRRSLGGFTALGRSAFSTTAARPVARVTIVGHLGDTPELQTTGTGRELLRYVVASNSGPRDKRQTSWFRVSSFLQEGAQRDLLLGLPKGTLVFIEGEVTAPTYQDSDGKTRTAFNIVQRSIEVLKRPTPSEGEEE